tara:strand:+ start:60 stop:425 length:366 start_codon:yes stop_codon:yes gene_type:complete
MPMKQQGRKIYRTAQGKMIDMDLLRQRNELVPAVGNAKVNARGDELGPGGVIIRKREDVLKEYYESSEGMPIEEAVTATEEPIVASKKSTVKKKPQKIEEEVIVPEDKWIEDEEGNFYKKE